MSMTVARAWRIVGAALLVPLAGCAGGPGGDDAGTRTTTRSTTPSATRDVGAPTAQSTEGPYFKPGSPQRRSLVPSGTPVGLVISGTVLGIDGRPIPAAKMDFWQADSSGRYDLDDFGYRGHQFTDDEGEYRLETVLPGPYSWRTRHIHVRVSTPDRPTLTTQLYFPGEPRNDRDPIFDERLLVDVTSAEGGVTKATFDFVLPR